MYQTEVSSHDQQYNQYGQKCILRENNLHVIILHLEKHMNEALPDSYVEIENVGLSYFGMENMEVVM